MNGIIAESYERRLAAFRQKFGTDVTDDFRYVWGVVLKDHGAIMEVGKELGIRGVAPRIVRLRNNKESKEKDANGRHPEIVTARDETDMLLCVKVAAVLRKRPDPVRQRMDVD